MTKTERIDRTLIWSVRIVGLVILGIVGLLVLALVVTFLVGLVTGAS